MKIDLHSHTTASDGTFTVEEILKEAEDKKLAYYAITDHDTIDGVKEAVKISKDSRLIPGVEISAEFPKTMHILGYGFDIEHKELNKVLDELQQYRFDRNKKMLVNMKKYNFHLTLEELMEKAGSPLIGRPHFAELMVEKGYVKNKQEAFDKYLAKGKPLYMNKKRLYPKAAIELINRSGGIAVMAHPYQTKRTGDDLDNLIKELVGYGLKGIEVFHSDHTKEQEDKLLEYASKYDLIITSGSDFHGSNKQIELGMETDVKYLQKFIHWWKNEK